MKLVPVFDEEYCYKMGRDCGKNGSNMTNCHFALFSSPEKTTAWEHGKRDAEGTRESLEHL